MVRFRHDLTTDWPFSSLDFEWRILYRLLNHSLLSPDKLASRAPRSNWKRFDSSGRISQVAEEVRLHEDWLLLQPLLGSLWPETTVSRCESVCMVN